MKIYVFQEIDSTNTEARNREKYSAGDVIVAINQTAGRGQRGNKWSTREGENLTFSVVVEPEFLPAAHQFLLSETTALSVSETLGHFGIETRIKWTNDVYVGENKICGILIENDLRSAIVERSILGIGINVNQVHFDEWIPNPTSVALELGRKVDKNEVLERFCEVFERRYDELKNTAESLAEGIQHDYNERLFHRDISCRYFIPGRGEVMGIIRGVMPTGDLAVEINGITETFRFKEIEFILGR